jgi:aminopeptidase N
VVFSAQGRLPGIAVIHENLSDMNKILNPLVYEKAGWVLHMLREQMGNDVFWAGIREYYRRYRDGNASSEDFQKVMEETAHTDMAWFFRQWLKRPGTPVIEGWWRYDSQTHHVEIDLTQTQPGEPYRLPLEIGLSSAMQKIELHQKQQHFTISSEREPVTVTLDPNTRTLMSVHFSKK